jgi:hypothetical protein
VLHALLCLSPVLALAIPLLARRYPGERTLLALRGEQSRKWPRPRSCGPSAARRVVSLTARGGQLIARYLAVRPPPALNAAS